MENKIRILLADSAEQKLAEFTSNLQNEPDFSLVGQTSDGYKLIEMVAEEKPDAIVMGLVLDGIDGLTVLSRLQKYHQRPVILVYSAWSNMMEIAAALGADFFMIKTSNTSAVCERLRQLVPTNHHIPLPPKTSNTSCMENQVTAVLMELGIPSHVRGFKYLRKAVINSVENPKTLEGITKMLYPSIAKCFDSTSCRVERAIRHAIEIAWESWGDDVQRKYFGKKRFYENHKPTNGEFIAIIGEYIAMQQEQRRGA